jgi:dienelactone hydrolase
MNVTFNFIFVNSSKSSFTREIRIQNIAFDYLEGMHFSSLGRRASIFALVVGSASAVAIGSSSCSVSTANPPGSVDAGTNGFVLEVPCIDTDTDIYDSGPDVFTSGDGGTAELGDVVKCVQESNISGSDLYQTNLADHASEFTDGGGNSPRPYTSGAFVYRVLYRTKRGTGDGSDAAATPGVSSAVVFVPDRPAAAKLPVIVISHGTVGQGQACTPTETDPVNADIRIMAYPLVGAGYVVIAPDLAGYAEYGEPGNTPSGYAGAVDVGRSTIDGARALTKMFAHSVTGDTILVGHSQGGHTTLSAIALADTYASPDVKITAAVTYAPLWLSQRSWGALFFLADQYTIVAQPLVNAITVWYHYTNGELMNPGHGLDIFEPSKQTGIKHFVDDDCEADSYPDLQALGTTAKDLFTQDFQNQITLPAALGAPCAADAGLCDTWIARYAADRPHLTGSSAQIPILIEYGKQDTTIPPDRMACVFDRLNTDKANYTACLDPSADHTGVVLNQADYVTDWIASKALDAGAPPACALNQSALTNDDGGLVQCATPPPND